MFTHAGQRFERVATARLFSTLTVLGLHPEIHPCTWMVERGVWLDGGDDWPAEYDVRVEDCGAEAVFHDNGWQCADGHEHTTAEVREEQGWDYAEDNYDAAVIHMGGRDYRPMTPSTVFDEREIARIATTL